MPVSNNGDNVIPLHGLFTHDVLPESVLKDAMLWNMSQVLVIAESSEGSGHELMMNASKCDMKELLWLLERAAIRIRAHMATLDGDA